MKLSKAQRGVLADLADNGLLVHSVRSGGWKVSPSYEPYYLISPLTAEALCDAGLVELNSENARAIYYGITDAGRDALDGQS